MQLGGNSLRAGAVASRVRKALALEQDVPAAWLFVHQTIRQLAEQISRSMVAAGPLLTPLRPSASTRLLDPSTGLDTAAEISFQQVPASRNLLLALRTAKCPVQRAEGLDDVLSRSNSCSCGSKTRAALLTIRPGVCGCKAAWTPPTCKLLCNCLPSGTW